MFNDVVHVFTNNVVNNGCGENAVVNVVHVCNSVSE